jgi:hypothetical protein
MSMSMSISTGEGEEGFELLQHTMELLVWNCLYGTSCTELLVWNCLYGSAGMELLYAM